MNKYLTAAVLFAAPLAVMAQTVDGSTDVKGMVIGALIVGVSVVATWFGTKHMATFIKEARADNEQNWKDVVVSLTDKLYASYPSPDAPQAKK